MKKGLIIIAAALFVAAMVLPAMAADMSISGFYRIRGFYVSNQDDGQATPWDPGKGPLQAGSPDAWWDHMLQLNPVFKVADNLKLVTRVSAFNNRIFGTNKTSGAVMGPSSVLNWEADAENIVFNRAYIEWKTAKGTFKFGRQATGVTFLPFANSEQDGDRIRWDSPNWNGFTLTAYTQKVTEEDAHIENDMSDADKDAYRIAVQYTQPCYFLGYALDYNRDRTNSNSYKSDQYTHNICVKANDPTKTYFFEGELQILAGDYKDYYAAGSKDVDYNAYGYYAAVGMARGPLTVAVAAIGVSGDDNAEDDDYKVGPSTGLDFKPLYIVFNPYSNILISSTGAAGTGRTHDALSGLTDGTQSLDTGLKAYALLADYVVNPQLTLHGGLGMAKADKVGAARDDDFGTELDLGLKYQIMSNLAYELHFGYLWTGDYWKGAAGSGYQVDDIYQIDHSLTLSF